MKIPILPSLFVKRMTASISSLPKRTACSGIGLVELVVTVAVLAIVATIGVFAVNGINRGAQHSKLESDVQNLNAAIKLYVSNGGNLGSLTNPSDVLAKLKTSRSQNDKKLHVGAPSGRFIDPRVAAVAVPADSWKLRAVYNRVTRRFEVATAGAGVEFLLDPSIAEAAAIIETRSHGAVNYAQNSSWVWDHTATNNPSAPQGPSVFNTNPNVNDTTPTLPPPPPPPPPAPGPGPGPTLPPKPNAPRLATPVFDKNSGSYSETAFPLQVTITNRPAGPIADAIYQINSNAWLPYTGPVAVPMNSSLRAQFLSRDPNAQIDSYQAYAYYYPVPDSLSGTVSGDFHSPIGGPNLVYTITNNSDRFTHGDPVYILDGEPVNSGDPNVLQFTSQSFANVAPWQKFKLGSFFYHNGSSYYDSHATGVKLAMTINLPDRGAVLNFNLDLDLINTPNDPDDAVASADYVRITNLTQNIPLQINGVKYRIQLEFGATDSFGFSSKSQFHVYEGATGQGELLGTFLPN
jgi:type II secretory pathway pseudopilin PulG